MSAFFMVADTTGRQGALSTAKIAPAMKALPNSTNGPSRFRDGRRIVPTPPPSPVARALQTGSQTAFSR